MSEEIQQRSAKPQMKQALLNPTEIHVGWIENLKSERRNQILSLQKSMNMPETVDKRRVGRLLQHSVDMAETVDEKFIRNQLKPSEIALLNKAKDGNLKIGDYKASQTALPTKSKRSASNIQQKKQQSNDDIPYIQVMMNMRNHLALDPFDEFDPHHRISGRKAFDQNHIRCMQSKIKLKFVNEPAGSKQKRPPSRIRINQDKVNQMDNQYASMCDNRAMGIKFRAVSEANPFEVNNRATGKFLKPDYILEKPCKIQDLDQFKSDKPLAGKFSEIGQRTFQAGCSKAKLIHTGPWGEISMLENEKQKFKNKIPIEPNKIWNDGPIDNHTHLHAFHMPPAYMTNQDAKYIGGSQTQEGVMSNPTSNKVSPRLPLKTPKTANAVDSTTRTSTSPCQVRISPERQLFLNKAKESRSKRWKDYQETSNRQRKGVSTSHQDFQKLNFANKICIDSPVDLNQARFNKSGFQTTQNKRSNQAVSASMQQIQKHIPHAQYQLDQSDRNQAGSQSAFSSHAPPLTATSSVRRSDTAMIKTKTQEKLTNILQKQFGKPQQSSVMRSSFNSGFNTNQLL